MNSTIDPKMVLPQIVEPPKSPAYIFRYREPFRLLYNNVVGTLPCKVEESYAEECWEFFINLRNQLKKNVGFHSYFELAPAVIYLFLRSKKIPLFTNRFIEASRIPRYEVERTLLFMVKTFPHYQIRFSYQIARQKIRLVVKILQLEPEYESYTLKVLRAFYPFLRHTKEDLILATAFILSHIAFKVKEKSIFEICNTLGIAMSAVQYQIKNYIFRPLHIMGFTSLKDSAPRIQKLVLSIVPLPTPHNKSDLTHQKQLQISN